MKCIAVILIALNPFFTIARQDPYAGIIPAPASIKRSAGEFAYSAATVIKTDQPNHKAVQFLVKRLKNKLANDGPTVIELTSKGAAQLPVEGYTLHVTTTR